MRRIYQVEYLSILPDCLSFYRREATSPGEIGK